MVLHGDDLMWPLIFIVIFIILMSTYTIMKKTNTKQIELDDLNTLYQCTSCGKLHRKYQEELQSLIDLTYSTPSICPRCHQPADLYIGEYFDWMKTNPECPELRKQDLRKFKKTVKKARQLEKELQNLDAFLHYYHPINKNKNSSDRDGKLL